MVGFLGLGIDCFVALFYFILFFSSHKAILDRRRYLYACRGRASSFGGAAVGEKADTEFDFGFER